MNNTTKAQRINARYDKIWDAYKTQRDAERENDLRQESREVEEREASGYWDNAPCSKDESTTD